MTRIALLCSTAPRTILRCAPSIKGFLQGDVDVFCHLWNDELSKDDEQRILDVLEPKLFSFSPLYDFRVAAHSVEGHQRDCRDLQTLFWRTYSIWVASECMSQAETPYEWVVWVRPDLEFRTQGLDLDQAITETKAKTDSPHATAVLHPEDWARTAVMPERGHYNGWNSQMAIFRPEAMKRYAEQIFWMTNGGLQHDHQVILNDERLVKRWLLDHNRFDLVTLPIDYKIIRKRQVDWPYDQIEYHVDRDPGVF